MLATLQHEPATADPRLGAGARREACLRPEHAQRYPGIAAGHWEPAATLADRVLAGSLLRGRDVTLLGRPLLEAHFQFRGGVRHTAGDARRRPRREDRG